MYKDVFLINKSFPTNFNMYVLAVSDSAMLHFNTTEAKDATLLTEST